MWTHEVKLEKYEATTPGGGPLQLGTAESQGNEFLHIKAGEGWEGLSIKVVFRPCKVSRIVPKDGNNMVDVPWEATKEPLTAAKGKIVFRGLDEGGRVINSLDLPYTVLGHSSTESREENEYTPNMIDQLIQKVEKDSQAAQQAAQDAADAQKSAEENAQKTKEDADRAEKAVSEVNDLATAAEKSAAAAAENAQKAEDAAAELDKIVKDGPVISVNGKSGNVSLTAADIPFDNTGTPLVSANVQDALTELLLIGGGGSALSTIRVTAPAGALVTVQKGEKIYTQTVGEDGAALTFRVLETGYWDVLATLDGAQDTASVNVAEAGGSYSVTLDFAAYKAYIKVTGPDGAMVNATKVQKSVSGTISGGSVTLTVNEEGEWAIAATYQDGVAQDTTVNITTEGETYTAEVKFCTLTVTAPDGSSVEAKNGNTTLSGTANSGSIKFWLPNTGTWTITATLDGQTATGSVDCAAYQDYSTELAYFSATIKATAVHGATVKAVLDDYTVSGEAGSDGIATLTVLKSGSYNVSATYSNASSNTKSVQVSESGQEYTVSVEFITLTVTAPEGSAITAQNGDTTLTETGGIVKFYLPNTGTWTITATLDGQTATGSMDCSAYQDYSTELAYFSATIKATAVQGATVKAVLDDYTVSAEAGSDGVATLSVIKTGSYTVSATYNGVSSNTKTVEVSESGHEYTVSVEFITLTVTAPEGSTITVKNGATTLSETGGIVKFYLPNTGTWTVTAELGGETASSEVQATEYKDYPVELSYIPETLNDATWAQIHQLSASGKLGLYFDDGDTKDVVLNGQVGDYLTIDNLTISTFIIGINHNSEREGENLTHFAIGKIDGRMVALCDSVYRNTNGFGLSMNTSTDSFGGWESSNMRKNILGNDSTPEEPFENSLLAAIPGDLRAVMQQATKYTDNIGNNSDKITATLDYLWLLAEFEVFGIRKYASEYEQNFLLQYNYFKSGNDKISYKHLDNEKAAFVHLRSPYYYLYQGFCNISSDGNPNSAGGGTSQGVLVAFAV